MAEKTDEWFVTERSRVMALMYLSHRKDLLIKDQRDDDIGLNYILYLVQSKDAPALRPFGLVLRGTVSPVREDRVNKLLQPTVRSFLKVGQFPYPVGLLHFTMQDDQGYFTWIAEPCVSQGEPQLLVHSEAHARKFDRELLDNIVEQVERWYEAFYAKIAVKAS
jgi:hypothetical protein